MEGTRQELPFVVMLASLFGFAKAAFLGFMGIIGLVSWDDVTEPWANADAASRQAAAAKAIFMVGSPSVYMRLRQRWKSMRRSMLDGTFQ